MLGCAVTIDVVITVIVVAVDDAVVDVVVTRCYGNDSPYCGSRGRGPILLPLYNTDCSRTKRWEENKKEEK